MRQVNVYALISTIDDTVFYIGATVQKLESRLSHHISRRIDNRKNHFIYEILVKGGKVEILELDIVNENEAEHWEQFYIDLFRSFGFNLMQRRTSGYQVRERAKGIYSWSKKGQALRAQGVTTGFIQYTGCSAY